MDSIINPSQHLELNIFSLLNLIAVIIVEVLFHVSRISARHFICVMLSVQCSMEYKCSQNPIVTVNVWKQGLERTRRNFIFSKVCDKGIKSWAFRKWLSRNGWGSNGAVRKRRHDVHAENSYCTADTAALIKPAVSSFNKGFPLTPNIEIGPLHLLFSFFTSGEFCRFVRFYSVVVILSNHYFYWSRLFWAHNYNFDLLRALEFAR